VSRARRAGRRALCALAGCLLVAAALAAKKDAAGPRPAALPPVEVRDLYYGDVLFYFYQDDYFDALIRLTAAMDKERVAHHFADAELLLGGLYLSLGQHRDAGEIFARVLDRKGVPAAVKDRARFYLGKIWYQRGYFDQAADTLAAPSTGTLPGDMDAERRMLHAQALLELGRYADAVKALEGWKGPRVWQAYAQYNLGVALVREQRMGEGSKLLDAVGRLETRQKELMALRDKANLALGYAYLQAGEPALAKPVLARVRLEGPLSTKALLGVGWADVAVGEYKAALTPWLELRGRNLLDSAVQESYLALPYAFAKLGANGQAAEYYEAAVHEFNGEADRIDESVAAIREGKLLDALVKNNGRGEMGWFWQLQNLPDAPESRYLFHLLARNEFQEGLKNYRQLLFLERNLRGWIDSINAYNDMIATRRQRYAERLPVVIERLKGVDPDELRRRRTEIEAKLGSAESSGDVVALGTDHEREVYAKAEALEALAAGSEDPDAADAREKLRLIKGVVYWQMHQGFKARAWSLRKNLREVQQAQRETDTRWSLVKEAQTAVPDRNGEFAARIATLEQQLMDAQARVADLKRAQTGYLANIAVTELEAQKERLATYMVQARYALATLYDRAGADEEKAHTPAPPAPTAEPPAPDGGGTP
jgi:hypothetical protein